jgi:hypothetical protein
VAAQEHRCDISSMDGAHGPAISTCYEDEGHFWVDNGEYASQVNYCPVCGQQAPNPAEPWKPKSER